MRIHRLRSQQELKCIPSPINTIYYSQPYSQNKTHTSYKDVLAFLLAKRTQDKTSSLHVARRMLLALIELYEAKHYLFCIVGSTCNKSLKRPTKTLVRLLDAIEIPYVILQSGSQTYTCVSQKHLPQRKLRIKNAKNIFGTLAPKIPKNNQPILVIDDVIESGATLEIICNTLKKRNPGKIIDVYCFISAYNRGKESYPTWELKE